MYTNYDGEVIMEQSDLPAPINAVNTDTGISSGLDYQTAAIPYVAPDAPNVANLDFTAQPQPSTITPAIASDSWLHEIENGLNSIGQIAVATQTTKEKFKQLINPTPAPVIKPAAAPSVSKITVYLSLAAAGLVLYYLARGSRATVTA
jgi:hypothetical protein